MKPLAYVYTCRNPGQVALLWAHQPAPFGHGWIDVKQEPLVRLSDVEALLADIAASCVQGAEMCDEDVRG
jgi:hypothetical protein